MKNVLPAAALLSMLSLCAQTPAPPQTTAEPAKQSMVSATSGTADMSAPINDPWFPKPAYFRKRFETPSTGVQLQPPVRLSGFVQDGKMEQSLTSQLAAFRGALESALRLAEARMQLARGPCGSNPNSNRYGRTPTRSLPENLTQKVLKNYCGLRQWLSLKLNDFCDSTRVRMAAETLDALQVPLPDLRRQTAGLRSSIYSREVTA